MNTKDNDMKKQTKMKKLLDFIENTSCDKISEDIIVQAQKCFLDLAGVTTAGAKNNSSRIAADYVSKYYPKGNVSILRTGLKTNLAGAALANGMASNALDMDDGYSLLRGHPGAGFFGALISAGEYCKCSYGDLLSALVVAYEVSIREGYSIRDYYGWDHSSGSYSSFATAASVGKLLKLDREKLSMALGIADFIQPVTPAKRSCYQPSMNKDGIYWGGHAGVEAVLMACMGITGKNPVIIEEKYGDHINSLGDKWYIFNLYIKFYSCCRWVHSSISALSDLMKYNRFSADDVDRIDVYSFGNAGTLYMEAPSCEDEAQYNIKYPIAAQLLFGDCGPLESSTTKMLDRRVADTINKIKFYVEPEYDRLFPARRLSRVEVSLKNGDHINSGPYEPKGERNSEISLDEIINKVHRINDIYAPSDMTDNMIKSIISTPYSSPAEQVLTHIRTLAKTNVHPEIEFI